MLKRILLPLDPSPYTSAAMKMAISLAKSNDSEITGLVVLDQPGIESSTGLLPPGVAFYARELEHTKMDLAKVHIQNLLSKFKAKCDEAGVRNQESNSQGSPSKRICEFANYYDLLVTGIRNHFRFETSDDMDNTINETLEHTVAPVLALPENSDKFTSKKGKLKTVIAVNESINSLRSLRNFIDIFTPGQVDCTMFVSDKNEEKAESIYLYAKEQLEFHGFSNIHKLVTDKDKIDVFNEEYLDQIDMVVLGAHSKIGIFDFLVGSLTKHLINENRVMLFVSQ